MSGLPVNLLLLQAALNSPITTPRVRDWKLCMCLHSEEAHGPMGLQCELCRCTVFEEAPF